MLKAKSSPQHQGPISLSDLSPAIPCPSPIRDPSLSALASYILAAPLAAKLTSIPGPLHFLLPLPERLLPQVSV